MAGAADKCSVRRAASERGYNIPDLGLKVKHLKGLLGYLFSNEELEDRAIADALGLPQAAQWTRKKSGALVTVAELSRLLAHFRLSRRFDYMLFTRPFDEYAAALRDAGVGAPGPDGQEALRALLSRATNRGGGIRLRYARHRRAGLGIGPAVARDDDVAFPIGARVVLEVDVAEPGYLLILNDCYPAGETSCLMPSPLRPVCTVTRGTVTLPAHGLQLSAMTVVGPTGDYRIYAVWTRSRLDLDWMAAATDVLYVLDDKGLTALADEIGQQTAAGAFLIRTAEYRVDNGQR